MNRIPYQDLKKMSEDERITFIGRKTMELKGKVAVLVDSHPRSIAERYIKKILLQWPELIVTNKLDFERGSTLITVQHKDHRETEN